MPFLSTLDCRECGATFESADKWATFCARCDRRLAAINAIDQGPKITGYTVDRNRRGASREAMKLLRGER